MITPRIQIRKHVHNNRGIIQGVIRISGRNEFITPSSIHNCNNANFFFFLVEHV
jgi:hypothetical protein